MQMSPFWLAGAGKSFHGTHRMPSRHPPFIPAFHSILGSAAGLYFNEPDCTGHMAHFQRAQHKALGSKYYGAGRGIDQQCRGDSPGSRLETTRLVLLVRAGMLDEPRSSAHCLQGSGFKVS